MSKSRKKKGPTQAVTLDDIRALIRANGQGTIDRALLGVSLARELTERNERNPRAEGATTSDAYARDIYSDAWHWTGGAIALDDECYVLDGIHRCWGVVKAGKAIIVNIAYGVDAEAIEAIDSGRPRLYSQVLQKQGEKHVRQLSACASYLWHYLNGSLSVGGAGPRVSNAERRRILEGYPDMAECLHRCVELSHSCDYVISPTVLGFVYFLAKRAARGDQKKLERVESFLEGVMTGLELPGKTDPRYKLRSKLTSARADGAHFKGPHLIALCITAWNAYAAGRNIARMPSEFPRGMPELEDAPRFRANLKAAKPKLATAG